MATLLVLQGPDKGKTFKTTDEVVVLGRGRDQVPLTDRTISRQHAELSNSDNGWIITDQRSANGTYVNGVRITKPYHLKHGDQIRMGSTLLVYTGDESVEQLSGASIPRDLVTLDAGSDHIDSAIHASVPSNDDSVVMAAPETADAVKAWNVLRGLTEVIGHFLPPDQLLARCMDIILEEVDVERGVVFVSDEESRELIPEVVRFKSAKSRKEGSAGAIFASRTIMNHVVESRSGVLCSNVVTDKRFESGKSVQNLGMRSVICVPIMARERVLGVIHLDCPVTRHTYTEQELRLLTAIGYQTGLAIENARLVQAQVQRERLAAAGETVAYLSHSIKNILQGMRAGADVVTRGIEKRDFAITTQGWQIVDRNLDKCFRLMLNMLAFSKEREPRMEMLQLNTIVHDAVGLVQKQADAAGVMLLADLDENLPAIPLDYDGLHQVILNLVINAIEAVPRAGGRINIRTEYDAALRHVALSVADNGPGVPAAERAKIFSAFHSTKGHGGTGLGLAVARKIVGELNGTIELISPPDGGAEFRVRLPAYDVRMASADDTHAAATRI
ncbi:MAG: Adaptive-response sensory-kinase SasA [Phycisphaerae bacterium]|nr:Adaptive-response sensory-kinase SasA [Phycisphaerae bacterium]